MNHGNHLKPMLIAAIVVAAGLIIFGAPTGSALLTAAALACPLDMVAMMVFMNHNSGYQAGHGSGRSEALPPVAGGTRQDRDPRHPRAVRAMPRVREPRSAVSAAGTDTQRAQVPVVAATPATQAAGGH